MKKRIGALLLVLVLALGLCAGASAAETAPDWNEGTFGDGAFSWRLQPSGTLTVTPSNAASMKNYRVYAACYDSAGRFLGAKAFSSGLSAAQLDPRTVEMKFMWTNGALVPQCAAATAAAAPQSEKLKLSMHYIPQTQQSTHTFEGFVSPADGASLTVDGRAVELTAYGAYSITLPMEFGRNVFTFTASNTAGETASTEVSVWRTLSGKLSQDHVFLAGNTWTAAQDAYLVPIVDARGVSTTLPVTGALKDAIAADSMEPDRFSGNAYVGRLCSITELDDAGVVSALTPAALRDVAGLGNDVIVLQGGYAYDYDDITECVYVDLGRDDAGHITVERAGAFDPERFFDSADVDASASDAPFVSVMAAVTAQSITTADSIYVVRTLRQSPLQPSIRLQTSQLTLGVGSDSLPLQSVVYPAGGVGQELVWSSSDPAVATVHGGVVHAVAEGTAEITLSTADGTVSDSCTCTVTEVPPVCMVTATEVCDIPGASSELRAELLFMDGSTEIFTVSKVNGRAVAGGGQTVSPQDAQLEIAGQQGGDTLNKFFSARVIPNGLGPLDSCELTELNSAGGTSPDWEDPVSVGNGTDAVASICRESTFAKEPDAAVGWSQPLRGWPIASDNLTYFIVKKVNGDGDTIYTVYRGFREVPEMEASRLTAICRNISDDPASVSTMAAYVYIEAAS